MLQDYRELATSLKAKFQSISKWSEIEFNSEDKRRLKELGDVTSVDRHSFQIKIDSNHCVIPGQYILYAICIKELALAVKEHMDFFEIVKNGKTANEVGTLLTGQQFDFTNIVKDEHSKKLGLKIFIDNDLNQGAKSIVNGTAGNYTIRGVSDFYTSIILKPINIPAASSSILGKFIYQLTEHPDLFNYLEKRFINYLPYVTKEQTISKFVRNVLSFLLQYDKMGAIKGTYTRNAEPSLISIKDGGISLTSIFKTSATLLDDEELSQGNRLRFFREPLYLNENSEFVYLSTEWTDGTGSRLDLASFKALIEKHYPEFILTSENETYFLKNTSGYRYQTDKQIGMNVSQINVGLQNAGLEISSKIVTRFIGSLLTKPFVILTGLSGSGKTKLVQAFSMWLCENENQYCIVPVGADWTNREPLLGYPNALEKEDYKADDFGVLQLIIEANMNPDKPYFLILDEMNLSHVERYFADFLSVMESKTKLSLHSGDKAWNGIPSTIGFPQNLFIVGTVNIDETTYMFSPKVLDRANVIEFRVSQTEMEQYLNGHSKIDFENLAGSGAGMAGSFVDMAKDDSLATSSSDEIKQALLDFFSALKKAGAEFGYRSASEILRFVAVVNKIEPSWKTDEIMDAAIMQKLLPKVHGSRRKLEPVFKTLGNLCLIGDETFETLLANKSSIDFTDTSKIKYPISLEKILRMYDNLLSNGFTSYAEA